MKKVISLLLSFILVLSAFSFCITASADDVKLKFTDGQFKILNICDCQDVYPSNHEMFDYINEVLDKYKPDLVVLGGDNCVAGVEDYTELLDKNSAEYKEFSEVISVYNSSKNAFSEGKISEEELIEAENNYIEKVKYVKELAIKELVAPYVEHETYFTLVFGNHDHQQFGDNSEKNREENKEYLLSLYQKYGGEYCIAYDAVPELFGVGTHNLPIYSSDGSSIKYNLYMFDSNTYHCDENGNDTGLGYDAVHKDQIEWYKNTRDDLKSTAGDYVPSIAFQHIVVGEVYDALYTESAVSLGELGRDFNGKHYTFVPKTQNFEGFVNEPPCPGYENYGQLDAVAEKGDVQAMFFGHDHTNSYVTSAKGVALINTPGITYHSYSSELNHGCRLITIDEKTQTYSTEVITVNALAVENKEYATKIGKTAGVAYIYELLSSVLQIVRKLSTPLGYIFSIFG